MSFSVFPHFRKLQFITGTIVTLYPGRLFLVAKASCRYRVCFSVRFASMFCCIGHAMSQIPICFSFFTWRIKSGDFAVSVFLNLDWKSQTSFALSFSSTGPRSYLSLYHTLLAPINSYTFAYLTASTITVPIYDMKFCPVVYSDMRPTYLR